LPIVPSGMGGGGGPPMPHGGVPPSGMEGPPLHLREKNKYND